MHEGPNLQLICPRKHNLLAARLPYLWLSAVVAFGLTVFPSTAFANVGLPMLALAWPTAWVAILPVCMVEGAFARRMLNLPTGQALKVSFVANLISTLFGVPLAWGLSCVVGCLIILPLAALPEPTQRWGFLMLGWIAYAPWLPPGAEQHKWWIPLAGLILCLPFYAMSVRIETSIAGRMLPDAPTEDIRRWSLCANRVTYLSIATILLLFSVYFAFKRG